MFEYFQRIHTREFCNAIGSPIYSTVSLNEPIGSQMRNGPFTEWFFSRDFTVSREHRNRSRDFIIFIGIQLLRNAVGENRIVYGV